MTAHNHNECLAAALGEAEVICRERGLDLTKTRRRVLELVWGGHNAVKAYDLIHQFDGGQGATKPPTIYRALDFLIKNGLVHRIESLNSFVGCNHPGSDHEGNFLICDECHQVVEIEEKPGTSSIEKLAGEKGFSIRKKTVEVHGTCSNCSSP